jgi:hypothetical protein
VILPIHRDTSETIDMGLTQAAIWILRRAGRPIGRPERFV